jgi:hypothetical protein
MALTITNEELEGYVGREFGYGDADGSFVGEQADDVARAIATGKRAFYHNSYAYDWSFLTPVRTFTLTENVSRFDLPADLAILHGPIHFAIGSEEVRRPITLTSPEHVQYQLQRTSTTGLPEISGYRPKSHDEGSALASISYELLVYPIPDDDYEVALRYTINPLAPTVDTLLPIGDQFHVQTLIEACLAAVERFNGESGIHEAKFQELLAGSIKHDQQVRAPEFLGQNRDTSDHHWDGDNDMLRRGAFGGSLTLYNGVAP